MCEPQLLCRICLFKSVSCWTMVPGRAYALHVQGPGVDSQLYPLPISPPPPTHKFYDIKQQIFSLYIRIVIFTETQ